MLRRVLATVLFTDIVDSTAQAAELGDANGEPWSSDTTPRRPVIARYGGTEVDTAGDGSSRPSTDRAGRPRRAGDRQRRPVPGPRRSSGRPHRGVRDRQREAGWPGRQHRCTHRRACQPVGGARVETVRNLVAGSGMAFDDRGTHRTQGRPRRVADLGCALLTQGAGGPTGSARPPWSARRAAAAEIEPASRVPPSAESDAARTGAAWRQHLPAGGHSTSERGAPMTGTPATAETRRRPALPRGAPRRARAIRNTIPDAPTLHRPPDRQRAETVGCGTLRISDERMRPATSSASDPVNSCDPAIAEGRLDRWAAGWARNRSAPPRDGIIDREGMDVRRRRSRSLWLLSDSTGRTLEIAFAGTPI